MVITLRYREGGAKYTISTAESRDFLMVGFRLGIREIKISEEMFVMVLAVP